MCGVLVRLIMHVDASFLKMLRMYKCLLPFLPSIHFMVQGDVNKATVSYMKEERQTKESIVLAPVGLAFEFVHDIIDLATYAHGQSQSATYTERLIELVNNPYASILRLCKSKQSSVQSALGSKKQSSARTDVASLKAAQLKTPEQGMTIPAASASGATEVDGFTDVLKGTASEHIAEAAKGTTPAVRSAAVPGAKKGSNTDKLEEASDMAGRSELSNKEQSGLNSRAPDSAALKTWTEQRRQTAVSQSRAGNPSSHARQCQNTETCIGARF